MSDQNLGGTPWVTGDVITAERLNNMIIYPVHLTNVGIDNTGIDKSYNEIKEALKAGRLPLIYYDGDYGFYVYTMIYCYDQGSDENEGCVVFGSSLDLRIFITPRGSGITFDFDAPMISGGS